MWNAYVKCINCFRENYQGLVPPVMRSEQDFDAGAKYHVAANAGYVQVLPNVAWFREPGGSS